MSYLDEHEIDRIEEDGWYNDDDSMYEAGM